MNTLRSVITITLLLFISCNFANGQNRIPELDHNVTSFSDPDTFDDFQKADLDRYYPDLMNPQNQNDNAEEIYKAWGQIHQRIYSFLQEEDFKWDSDDPKIQIVNRIYFNADGTVKHYFFRILNESVSKEKRLEFGKILNDHFDDIRIDLTQPDIFAQCGKSAYPNS